MSRSLVPSHKSARQARRAYALAALLLAACWVVFGFAPFSSQIVNSQGTDGGTADSAGATVARSSLSLEERVRYQRAVEEVYWRHTLWPKQNAEPKPAFEAVVPVEATRAKVEDMLRKSEALARLWNRPVTAEQLQAEVARMARETKQPALLGELWQALGNDPFIVAEVLARPALVERLARNSYASDEHFHGPLRARAEEEARAHTTLAGMRQMSGNFSQIEVVRVAQKKPRIVSTEDTASAAASRSGASAPLELTAEEWEAETARLSSIFAGPSACPTCADAPVDSAEAQAGTAASSESLPTAEVSPVQEDANSFYVTSVVASGEARLTIARVEWAKTSFDAWWSEASGSYEAAAPAEDFDYSLPRISQAASATDDTWTPAKALPITTGTAVWTGTEMIIWGGQPVTGGRTNSGARYNPSTDTWTPTSTIGAASPRRAHSAVWTGTEMIVFGGCGPATNFCTLSDGARYNPSTDTWKPINNTNAGARASHTVVWTGSKMIVWGGCSHGYNNRCTTLNSGGVYNPASDSWTPTSTVNAPSARAGHTAVWTGTEMIVWGPSNTGGRYNPSTDSWTPTNTFNAPSARNGFTAVWTGTEMVVWGGYEGNFVTLNTGGRYNPANDSWTPTSTAGAPAPRYAHTAVWTGSEMVVFGGDLRSTSNISEQTNTGGRYNPSTDSWRPTSTLDAPSKSGHVAVWTGSEMIVWSDSNLKSGGRYNPSTDAWRPTDNNDSAPALELGVWSGAEMLVWGRSPGCISGCSSAGGRYNPATNSWRPMNTVNAPPPGWTGHIDTAVWTGTEMIVWGANDGQYATPGEGGRYNPLTDNWTPVTTTGAPVNRSFHAAVWTGSEMIVWGGDSGEGIKQNTGGRYNPANDSWQPTSTVNAPSARYIHSATWTGTEMIVWGGVDADGLHTNTGGRYNPSTDSWQPTSTTNAPEARRFHTAVWTGNELVIWGGRTGDYNSSSGILNTGGRYNPSNDSWQPTSLVGAPSARFTHSAVWTGTLMIVWGGQAQTDIYVRGVYTGARYNPSADAWTPVSTLRAPSARSSQIAVWTGSQMIVWGGTAEEGAATHGALYSAPGMTQGNQPPSVSINSPADNSTFESGANITINVNATDSDGTVSTVHFYANNTLIGSDNTAPFSFDWTNVRGGNYTLTATATDNQGGVATSAPVRTNVNVSNAPPTCALTTPANGATYTAPATVTIAANAQANRDRTISKVEFYDGDFLLGTITTAPYGPFNYSGLGAGTYTFTARCTDSAGVTVNSAPSVVTVNPAPTNLRITGQITNGANGLALQGLRLRLDSSASATPQYINTNTSGTYQFSNLQSGASYTVTPESSVYSFSPSSRSYSSMSQNDDSANFVATPIGYTISGRLTDASGNALYPATINLSGSATASAGTDVNGNYFFSNLAPGGNYTVQPYKNQYSFEPPYRTFNGLAANQTADFTGTTATPPARTNVALAANGGTASASSTTTQSESPGMDFSPAAVINGDRKGLNWEQGGGWRDGTSTYPDWIQVDFNDLKSIDEIDVFTIQDNYLNPSEPTETQSFSLYGITAFDVQYWDGSQWLTVPGGSVAGNNLVWRKFTFASVNTSKVRVRINNALAGRARVIEVEAWGTPAPPPARMNVALAANGATAIASSTTSAAESGGMDFSPASVINGDRKGLNWEHGGGWRDGTDGFPDWIEVDFNGSKVVNEINVFTIQDDYLNPSEPTETQSFSLYGITAFDVQYWDGSQWLTVPGGSVAGNNLVWRKFTFADVTTAKIRVRINNAMAGRTRIVEVEAWGPTQTTTPPPARTNVALAANGATASASSTTDASEGIGTFPVASIINGDRKGLNWANGGGWRDATDNAYPDWVQVDFNGNKTITEVSVFTIQDAYNNPSEPFDGMTFSLYGITAFDVQYWDGSQWLTVPGGSVTGNNSVKRTFTFPAITTGKIRVLVRNALAGRSRMAEVEAY